MRSLNITSIQRGCLYDGPGVRTTVFLRGCILKCPWCCNPETIFLENDFFLDNSKCLKIKHINSSLCDNCERYGGAISVDNCPFGVSERISDIYPFEDLINELLKDKTLFDATGGGITFSGGEPLLQVADLTDLCYQLSKDTNIWLESTLLVSTSCVVQIAPYIHGIFVDLKLQRENNLQTRDYIQHLKTRIKILKDIGVEVRYRLVFVDSILDDAALIINMLKDLDIDSLEILNCHNLARKKYEKLGLSFIDCTPNAEKLSFFLQMLTEENLNYSFLKI